jgi:Ca2+-binding EF-hand superfamily protein
MRKLLLWTASIGLILGMASLALAANDAAKDNPTGKGNIVQHILKQFDKNGDGALDASELSAFLDAREKHRSEAGKPEKAGKGAEHLTAEILLKKFDKNGDGKLDATELQEMGKELHSRQEAKKAAATDNK